MKKISLLDIQGKLTKDQMKTIMAGSNCGGMCPCGGGCSCSGGTTCR